MKNPTLNICMPTFNRGNTIIAEVNEYLKCEDSRFCVTIVDNCSTDGSYEILREINDSRFHLSQNDVNIGGMPNMQKALSNDIESEYLLFLIDRDFFDTSYLTQFIDILEDKQPKFGCVDLENQKSDIVECSKEGKESICKIGYLSKHPSGFFWKKELFDLEVSKPYFQNLPFSFDFWFDVLSAHLAVNNQCTIVYMPAILRKSRNPYYVPGKTSSYNETNYYFSLGKRIETFNVYMNDLFSLDISEKVQKQIAFWSLLRRTILAVSIEFRYRYQSSESCEHYNTPMRNVSWYEMTENTSRVMKVYWNLMQGRESKVELLLRLLPAFMYSILRITFAVLKPKSVR